MIDAWIFYLIAAVILLIGILIVIFSRKKHARCSEETTATIVSVGENVNMGSGRQERRYKVYYEFTARGATVRRQIDDSTTGKRKHKRGETCQVRYNPDNPNEFVLVGSGSYSVIGIALIISAIVICGLGIAAQSGAF